MGLLDNCIRQSGWNISCYLSVWHRVTIESSIWNIDIATGAHEIDIRNLQPVTTNEDI